VKTPAKKATKAAAKAPAKVAAPAKKVSPKSPVKAKATPAKTKAAATKVKPVAKPAAKAKPKAPAQKPVVKKPVVATKVPAKKTAPAKGGTVKKPAAKAAAKPQVVAKPKAAVPAKKAAPAPKAVGKASPTVKTKPEVKAAPVVATAAVGATVPVSPVAADLPVRSSRPSARLAQITVPSMPQAVASTAAKASFLPSMLTTVLPVPAAPAKKDPKLANNWKSKPVEKLTDAEVLAMPDSEYMNDVQMAFFRLKLVQLKQGILANAGETTEHLREDTVVVPDPADRATIEEEHALELRTRDRERKLLKKIEQSIARIDAGDYGYCDETGEPIGVGRLLARPTATLSLEAQQRRELKQKMFGD